MLCMRISALGSTCCMTPACLRNSSHSDYETPPEVVALVLQHCSNLIQRPFLNFLLITSWIGGDLTQSKKLSLASSFFFYTSSSFCLWIVDQRSAISFSLFLFYSLSLYSSTSSYLIYYAFFFSSYLYYFIVSLTFSCFSYAFWSNSAFFFSSRSYLYFWNARRF
jgi:hypothetical protein